MSNEIQLKPILSELTTLWMRLNKLMLFILLNLIFLKAHLASIELVMENWNNLLIQFLENQFQKIKTFHMKVIVSCLIKMI